MSECRERLKEPQRHHRARRCLRRATAASPKYREGMRHVDFRVVAELVATAPAAALQRNAAPRRELRCPCQKRRSAGGCLPTSAAAARAAQHMAGSAAPWQKRPPGPRRHRHQPRVSAPLLPSASDRRRGQCLEAAAEPLPGGSRYLSLRLRRPDPAPVRPPGPPGGWFLPGSRTSPAQPAKRRSNASCVRAP
ncbi:hypothetical protein ATSB10_28300 [Dyella thiooxydans]|uniref:Uncharacterized protein n=1 Tax=Dyella thiooxydans TaxID=445710 RepID=A0A160N3M1_9GAMM|nr:hypothetical protein ATSB10_28300 [Dyella thiooxydans]